MKTRSKLLIKLLSLVLVMATLFGVLATFTACDGVKKVEYAITYELNNGTNHAGNPAKYSTDDLPLTIKAATRTNYIFLGWTSELNTEKQLTVEIPRNSKKDLTFTAHWAERPQTGDGEYAIMYVMDGGTNHPDNPDKFTADDLPLTIQEPTREEYNFLGWISDLNTEKQLTVEIPEGTETSLVFTAYWQTTKEQEPENYGAGKLRAPDFTVRKVNPATGEVGETVSLTDYYGDKPVFISFWAYWCNPCLNEMKEYFNNIYDDMKNDFVLLAVHSDELSGLRTLLQSNTYTFPIFDDSSRTAISNSYETGYVPSNYMVDKWGYLYKPSNPSTAKVTNFNLSTMSSYNSMKSIINGAINRAKG